MLQVMLAALRCGWRSLILYSVGHSKTTNVAVVALVALSPNKQSVSCWQSKDAYVRDGGAVSFPLAEVRHLQPSVTKSGKLTSQDIENANFGDICSRSGLSHLRKPAACGCDQIFHGKIPFVSQQSSSWLRRQGRQGRAILNLQRACEISVHCLASVWLLIILVCY